VWLLLAEILMVAGFGFPHDDVGGPDTLLIVHMVCVGWLSTVVCGALFQFVPVLAARPLHAERWTLPALSPGPFATSWMVATTSMAATAASLRRIRVCFSRTGSCGWSPATCIVVPDQRMRK
jgi:hypothetical protein